MKHIHILGICGTFMGSLAQLAVKLGYKVTGCDKNVYPPMSTLLNSAGIEIIEGYGTEQLDLQADCYVIGNAMGRGNPLVEAILDQRLVMASGPQWLYEAVLRHKWVLAVSGTHGKTTTTSMLAWILEYAGKSPGFLVGGVPENFSESARLGDSEYFVIEADEYDTAFFDKRSKFVHYHPKTLLINNLEFDHADIFDDLHAIQTQFHHLVRIVPENGLIIFPEGEPTINEVIERGCWSAMETYSEQGGATSPWSYRLLGSLLPEGDGSLLSTADGSQSNPADGSLLSTADGSSLNQADGSHFSVYHQGELQGEVRWQSLGLHNVQNGMAAIAAAHHVGVAPAVAIEALGQFGGVKRRMELLGEVRGIKVYDDFAHHPTAIATTLAGLRKHVGEQRIIAIIEPRSNTMRMGVHRDSLLGACQNADKVLWYSPPQLDWDLASLIPAGEQRHQCYQSIDEILDQACKGLSGPAHIVIMSNGGFEGIHHQLLARLKNE